MLCFKKIDFGSNNVYNDLMQDEDTIQHFLVYYLKLRFYTNWHTLYKKMIFFSVTFFCEIFVFFYSV